ncbi:MAG: alpha/beta hydrolase [Burkholderiaceae bacterium]
MTTPARLDALYNNRALVPDHAAHFERWADDSAMVRATQPCHLDVDYSTGCPLPAVAALPQQTLDIFPAQTEAADGQNLAPVLVFIHGGYWRSLDKSEHSFVAPAFTRQGACVVVPNYALCPGTAAQPVTIPDIVMQMVQALAWTYRHIEGYGGDPRRISLVGHSAGGHLATQLLACLWPRYAADLPQGLVKNALSISGLYALDVLRKVPFLQASLQLSAKDAAKASPAWLPKPKLHTGRPDFQGLLFAVVGAKESPAFIEQNALIQKAWGKKRVPVCEVIGAHNHFSILQALVDPAHRLHGLATALLI